MKSGARRQPGVRLLGRRLASSQFSGVADLSCKASSRKGHRRFALGGGGNKYGGSAEIAAGTKLPRAARRTPATVSPPAIRGESILKEEHCPTSPSAFSTTPPTAASSASSILDRGSQVYIYKPDNIINAEAVTCPTTTTTATVSPAAKIETVFAVIVAVVFVFLA